MNMRANFERERELLPVLHLQTGTLPLHPLWFDWLIDYLEEGISARSGHFRLCQIRHFYFSEVIQFLLPL